MTAIVIETRDDPRKGLYPGMHQYRAACTTCGKKSRWFNFEHNARSSGDAHIGLSVVSNHCDPKYEEVSK